MCEIQFIKRLNSRLNEQDFQTFKELMYFGNLNNNCAWGLFNEQNSFKQSGSFNYKHKKLNAFRNSMFIVGHNRLATQGDKAKVFNNHPFHLNEFTLVHNGVISNYKDLKDQYKLEHKVETDSFIILWLINHFFKQDKSKKRQEHIINAISKTAELLEGSFSCFLYDRISKDLFYFKNNRTNFSFALTDDNVLIGTTEKENLDSIYLKKNYIFTKQTKDMLITSAKSNKIYLINEQVFIKEIGKFKDKEKPKELDYFGCYGNYGGYATAWEDEIQANLDYLISEPVTFLYDAKKDIVKIDKNCNSPSAWEKLCAYFSQSRDKDVIKIKSEDIYDYF